MREEDPPLPVREGPPQPAPPPKEKRYSADEVRGGEIILRTRARRVIFIAGLVGAVVLALLLRAMTGAG